MLPSQRDVFGPFACSSLPSWGTPRAAGWSQRGSSAPLLTVIPCCCRAFTFAPVCLEPLPSEPFSVGHTNLLSWLLDPVLDPHKQLQAAATRVDSPATPRGTGTRGNECCHPAAARASPGGKPCSSSPHPSAPARELTTNQPESEPEIKMSQASKRWDQDDFIPHAKQ